MDAMASTRERLEVEPAGLKDVPTVDSSGRELFAAIDGVEVIRLHGHGDGRGSLTPFLALTEQFWRDPVVYGYFITIRPGKIKGWGMHRHQADRYFVPPGTLRVVLYDGRVGSPSAGKLQQIWFSEQSGGLVRIPAGVWHADQNWGDSDALLVNFPTRPYDADDPDKYRIDPHSGEIEFDWVIRDG
jgi:dTDP-4-dehydrorhamnose 3,5-epimerase